MTTNNTNKSLWTLTIYFILSFFVLGASAMIHYFVYPKFDKVHEHISAFMNVFNSRVIFLFYIPSIFLLLSSISLFWFAPKNFPKWAIAASVTLSTISVATIFFVLLPIQNSFTATTGFETAKYNDLLSFSFTFQLIPILLQACLTFLFLNEFLYNIKSFGKWLFIIVFALSFFTAGSNAIEVLLNYPSWLKVGANEWLIFRRGGHLFSFILVYLLPAYLPLLFLLLMIWFRPTPIKRKFIIMDLGVYIYIFAISATYFVPKIQLQLNKAHSTNLIEELIKNEFPLRFLPEQLIYALAVFMFIKIGQDQIQETKR